MNGVAVESPNVEALAEEVRGLVYERQTMRSVGALPEELERNRLELVRIQQELVQALIRRHLPAARTAA
jgi:hypothetical protein